MTLRLPSAEVACRRCYGSGCDLLGGGFACSCTGIRRTGDWRSCKKCGALHEVDAYCACDQADFIRDVLGIELFPQQVQIIEAVSRPQVSSAFSSSVLGRFRRFP